MSEPRTVREARLAIRDLEHAIDTVRMSPAMALAPGIPGWYLRQAQARLRTAERDLAKADDPREGPLQPLAPTVARRVSTLPRRRRYRCTTCMEEHLLSGEQLEHERAHVRFRRVGDGYVRDYCGEWELVARRRPRETTSDG